MTYAFRNLFEISQDFEALEGLLLELQGEITNEDEENIIDEWFESLGEERDQKIEQYCYFIRENRMLGEIQKEESKRVGDLARVKINLADRLENRLFIFMRVHRYKDLQTRHFKLLIHGNGGLRPLIFSNEAVNAPDRLPAKYCKVRYEIDNDSLRKDLDILLALDMKISDNPDHLSIEHLREESRNLHALLDPIARYDERGSHLRIK